MVLHLLGKKSWNVYNTDNIERVKKDEAAAAARQEDQDRLMQEQDAARRTAILRGETPPTFEPLAPPPDPSVKPSRRRAEEDGLTNVERRQRRRQRDEDETSHAIRLASITNQASHTARDPDTDDKHLPSATSRFAVNDPDAPILDHKGHIQIFVPPSDVEIRKRELQEDKDSKNRKRDGGRSESNSNLGANPWYANQDAHSGLRTAEPTIPKNAFGHYDEGRTDRDAKRTMSNDPLAAMQRAQAQLRQAKKDKEEWAKEKEREARALEKEERRHRRKEHRHDRSSRNERSGRRDSDVGSLEGFELDRPAGDSIEEHDRHRYRHSSSRPHETKERSRSPGERGRTHRHRSRSRERERRRRSEGAAQKDRYTQR